MAVLLAVCLPLCISAAQAENASDALKEFGLIGTWSDDCSKDLKVACQSGGATCGIGTTYSVPLLGPPAMTFAYNYPLPSQRKTEIKSAEKVTAQKIKLMFVVSGRSYAETQFAFQAQNGEIWERILEKVGESYRINAERRSDGVKVVAQDGYFTMASGTIQKDEIPTSWVKSKPTPVMERCLN